LLIRRDSFLVLNLEVVRKSSVQLNVPSA
jgi:hypothetical protein